MQGDAAVLAKPRMNGDRTVHLTAAAEQTSQCELDFGDIAVGFCHTGEDLGGVVETIVDEMIEAYVVVARQTDDARSAVAAPEEPGGGSDSDERKRQQNRRKFKHRVEDSAGP